MQTLVTAGASLASTPPQHTPSRVRRTTSGANGSASNGVVSFRTADGESVVGSFSRSVGGASSFIESGSWRSASAKIGTAPAPAPTDPHGLLSHARSIPKSASYVKVEGFDAPGESLASSPPMSPGHSGTGTARASSLLSRQLSVDNLRGGAAPAPAPAHPAELASLAERLEAQVRGRPAVKPGSLPGGDDKLLSQLQAQFPVFHEPLVVRAFGIARAGHTPRSPTDTRSQAAFARCAGAGAILAELGADEVAVAAALLHDAPERSGFSTAQLRGMLQHDEALETIHRVAHMGFVCQKYRAAGNTTALGASADAMAAGAAEAGGTGVASHLVSMLVAHGPPRALLVRLAVALQEARALDARAPAASRPTWAGGDGGAAAAARASRRHRAAAEALEVWAPLANRLGVWAVKAELEDRAFCALRPDAYAELRERLEEAQEPTRLVALVDALRAELQAAGVEYLDLSGRPKHLWGVWKKMQAKGYSGADRVRDVRGLRVIVRSREDCYLALRAVERAWAVVGLPKNYIKDPKANGYQSLHAVADPGDGHLVEVQIRTDKMHYLAEYGAEAAHWRYKEAAAGGEGGADAGREATWAKFQTAQHVAKDKKCRPSGSPSGDNSLASILAAMDGAATSSCDDDGAPLTTLSAGTSPGTSARQGRSFAEYIAASGQRPAPPEEQRVLVAVVAGGAFSVAELAPGTTVAALLRACGAGPADLQVMVNRQVERDVGAVLAAGDVVELFAELPAAVVSAPAAAPAAPSPALRTPALQGNMVPVAGLTKKLAAAQLSS